MHSKPRNSRSSLTSLGAIGAVCIFVLIATVAMSQRSRVVGVTQQKTGVAAGETAVRAVHEPHAPTRQQGDQASQGDAASGPDAGEIPSDQHLGPDADVPAISKLNPKLRQALDAADKAMRSQGIQLWITSGWRTVAYQERLYDEAVAQHGVEYARTHVAKPDKTEHTSGAAVDVGPTSADDWLLRNGARFGLCQTYGNEIWHFELTARAGQCPAMRADALG